MTPAQRAERRSNLRLAGQILRWIAWSGSILAGALAFHFIAGGVSWLSIGLVLITLVVLLGGASALVALSNSAELLLDVSNDIENQQHLLEQALGELRAMAATPSDHPQNEDTY